MHYLDTSVFVTALTAELHTVRTRAWLVEHQQTMHVSDWVLTEFASAISRKVRALELPDAGRVAARRAMDAVMAGAVSVLSISRTHFRTAGEICDADVGLRSSDALHVALAMKHGLTVVSRDRRMVDGARALGVGALFLDEVA